MLSFSCQAANFLIMENLVDLCLKYVRKHHKDMFNFSKCIVLWALGTDTHLECAQVLRKEVEGLALKPAEHFRWKRAGPFDVVIRLASLYIKTHQLILKRCSSLLSGEIPLHMAYNPAQDQQNKESLPILDLTKCLMLTLNRRNGYNRMQALLFAVQFMYVSDVIDDIQAEVMPHCVYIGKNMHLNINNYIMMLLKQTFS